MPITFGRGKKAQFSSYEGPRILRDYEVGSSGFAGTGGGAARMPGELESIRQRRAAGVNLDNFTTKNRRRSGFNKSAQFSKKFNTPEVLARRAELEASGQAVSPSAVQGPAPTRRTNAGKTKSRSGNPAVRAGGGTSRKSKASKPAPLSPRPQVPTMPVMDPMSPPGARAPKVPVAPGGARGGGRRPKGRMPGRLKAGKSTGNAGAGAAVSAAAASAGVPTGNAGAGAAVSAALSQEAAIDSSPAFGKKSRGKRGARATGPVSAPTAAVDPLSAPTTRVQAAAAAAAGAPAGNAAPTTGAAVTAAVNNAPPAGSAGGAATGSRTINRSLSSAGQPSGMKRAGGAVRSALNMATETKGRRAALAVGAGVIGLGALLNGREKRGTSSGARSMYSY